MSADRLLRWGMVAFLLGFGFLPIVNWIPGGHEAPWFREMALEWLTDGALIAGAGVLLAIISGRIPGVWRPGWFTPLANLAGRRPGRAALLLALVALAVYSVVAYLVLGAKPLLIDEIVQVWQARVIAGGSLWLPTPEFPEFTSSTHLVDFEGRRFGQYPMGGPAMLALGSLLGAEHLVGPAAGALSAMLAWFLFRRVESRQGVALAAAVLFALAPFTVFMAGSHMNHVTVLTWLLVGMLGMAGAMARGVASGREGWLIGLGFGVAATIRPMDAVAFALPAAVWLVWQAARTRRLSGLVAAGAGIAIPMILLMGTNLATTGDPLRFGYQVLWGNTVGLGFHASPWGDPHTPIAGIELISLYFLRLQRFLFEAPFPALVPATIGLLLTRRLLGFDRYLLASAAILIGLYFAYWHDGFYLGPRFMYPLLPVLALWTARALPLLRERIASVPYRVVCYSMVVSLPLALSSGIAIRTLEYSSGFQSPRFDHDSAARHAGVRDALVLVRESWGAEVVVRMWALGIPRSEAESIYRRVDTCQLDQAVVELESRHAGPEETLSVLIALTADSSRVLKSTLTPDPTERMLPGATYPQRCMDRIRLAWEGFTIFPPALLAGEDGNVYVRDLGERDGDILSRYPGRAPYLLKPAGARVGLRPLFIPVSPGELTGRGSPTATGGRGPTG